MTKVFSMVDAVLGLLPDCDKEAFAVFPRDIEKVILYALGVPVIRQPELTLSSAIKFLCALRGEASVDAKVANERKLSGLLHIGSPCALIFVCANLPPHIQNYVLAHELGHLLADVFLLQNLWLKTLPEKEDAIKKYFTWDGRDPWLELSAFIKGLPLRPRAIVGRAGNFSPETTEREIIADLFAREVIAPWDVVAPMSKGYSRREFSDLLCERFGLPINIAAHYYDDLKRYFEPKRDVFGRVLGRLAADVT